MRYIDITLCFVQQSCPCTHVHPQDAQNAAARRQGVVSPKAKLMVADARFPETFAAFAVEAVGAMAGERQSRRAYERAQDSAQCTVSEDGQLQFSGMTCVEHAV